MTNNFQISWLRVFLLAVIVGLVAVGAYTLGLMDPLGDTQLGDTQQAAVYAIPKTTAGNYRVVTTGISGSRGACSVTVWDDAGNQVARYVGTWNTGAAGCQLLMPVINPPQPPELVQENRGDITKRLPGSYFTSPEGMLALQTRLSALGVLSDGEISGIFTEKTFAAIKSLQEKNKLPVTGFVDGATAKILESATKDLDVPRVKTMTRSALDIFIKNATRR